MERTIWLENNPDAAQIDKKEGVEHWSDGIRYYTDFRFPVKNHRASVHQGFLF